MTKKVKTQEELIEEIKKEEGIENVEVEIPLDDIELETLLDKSDEILPRQIEYFSIKHNQKRRINIHVKPMTHGIYKSLQNLVRKNTNKNIADEVVRRHLFKSNGQNYTETELDKFEAGITDSAYEEIRYISGLFRDKTQEMIVKEVVKND
jgi:hypothetical protein